MLIGCDTIIKSFPSKTRVCFRGIEKANYFWHEIFCRFDGRPGSGTRGAADRHWSDEPPAGFAKETSFNSVWHKLKVFTVIKCCAVIAKEKSSLLNECFTREQCFWQRLSQPGLWSEQSSHQTQAPSDVGWTTKQTRQKTISSHLLLLVSVHFSSPEVILWMIV